MSDPKDDSESQPEGVGPPESILRESQDINDVLNPDGTVKQQ